MVWPYCHLLYDGHLQKFGKNVSRVRRANDMTQERLSSLAGLARSYVGDIETGASNASLKTIEKFAVALNVTAGSLLD